MKCSNCGFENPETESSFCDSCGESFLHPVFRKVYISWFIILILPPILLRIGNYCGFTFISKDFAALLTIITKLGFIILTIWYGIKIGIKSIWAWILGVTTLLPFAVWISLIILLKFKRKKIQ
jgi:hypothetical protein